MNIKNEAIEFMDNELKMHKMEDNCLNEYKDFIHIGYEMQKCINDKYNNNNNKELEKPNKDNPNNKELEFNKNVERKVNDYFLSIRNLLNMDALNK